jgi:hypothetical protein
MAKSRYSSEYIAAVKAGTAALPTDKGQATYVQRLARNYEPGVSRSQLRGHARVGKGEKPLSVVKKEKPTPAQKPTLSKSGKSGKKNLGRHVTKQYNQAGEVRRTRVNARTSESLGKQLNRTPDSQGVIIHLVDKNGNVVKAVGQGKKHTASAGDLKKRIADNLAGGASWDDAIFDAIGESFDFYDEDGNYVADISSMSFTNIIMYTEAA